MLTTSAPDPSGRPDERDSHAALIPNVRAQYVRREDYPRLMESCPPFDLTGLVDGDSDGAVQPAEGGNLNSVRCISAVSVEAIRQPLARDCHSLPREIP